MARREAQKYGEIRDGLVMYENGKTWHYSVRWRGKMRHGDTKCESRTGAAQWLKDEKAKWAHEEHHEREKPIPTLREVWEAWIAVKKSARSATHCRYMKGVVFTHAEDYLDRPITDLTTAAVELLRAHYLETTGKGYSKPSPIKDRKSHATRTHSEGGANKMVGQLKAITGWAVETGRITARPFTLGKLSVSLDPKGVLWPEQVIPFLQAADSIRKPKKDLYPHSAILLRLMLGLGLREGEAINAEWQRIDWRRKVFIVAKCQDRRSKAKVKDRSIREVPIPHWLLVELLRLWNHEDKPTFGLVLVTKNDKPHCEGATDKAVIRAAKALKIHNLTPHRLRATFATGHFEVGTPLTQIAQMLGHEDPAITYKHYIVERSKDQDVAQERLAAAMGFTPAPSPKPVVAPTKVPPVQA